MPLEKLSQVSLQISREGDFSFHGNCSEYEVVSIIEAWKQASLVQRRHKNVAYTLGIAANLARRFSWMAPVAVLLMFLAIGAKRCSPPEYTHPTQVEHWQYDG